MSQLPIIDSLQSTTGIYTEIYFVSQSFVIHASEVVIYG